MAKNSIIGIVVDTNTLTGIIVFLKAIMPALIGSGLAIWYRKDNVNLKDLSFTEKLSIFILVLAALFLGVWMSHVLGGALIQYSNVEPSSYYADLIKAAVGLSSLKILDSSIKSIDEILIAIRTGLVEIIKAIQEGIMSKIKRFFGDK